eukprot:Ihof_evm14s16 gene=Ihof_evmTU14s16
MDQTIFATERRNLNAVLRVCVHNLVVLSGTETIKENHDLVLHLCRILEASLSHGLVMVANSSSYFIGRRPSEEVAAVCFWDYINEANNNVQDSCRETIRNLQDLSSSRIRGQTWIRLSLMEKRLADYIVRARNDDVVTRKYYNPYALLRSDDGLVMITLLDVLRSVDFTFCLKDERHYAATMGPVDFAYFLESLSQPPTSAKLESIKLLPLDAAPNDMNAIKPGIKFKRKTSLSILNNMEDIKESLRLSQEQKAYLEEQMREKEKELNQERQKRRHAEIERDIIQQDMCRLQEQCQAE